MLYDGIEYDIDEELSFKDFFNLYLGNFDLSNKVIYATSFANERPDTPLPEGTTGAIFIRCNLDNIDVPLGNTIIDCSIRRFEVQADGKDWLIDEDGNPIKKL